MGCLAVIPLGFWGGVVQTTDGARIRHLGDERTSGGDLRPRKRTRGNAKLHSFVPFVCFDAPGVRSGVKGIVVWLAPSGRAHHLTSEAGSPATARGRVVPDGSIFRSPVER